MATHSSHASLPYPIRKARYTIGIPYLDADGDPTDPTTPDTEFSLDAGAFADCAEEVTTISGSNGSGLITLTGAETDGSLLFLAAKVASGPKNTLATLYPKNLPILSSGTLSAGAAGGGTLGTVLAYDVTGCFIRTTGGTGGGGTGGASNQARRIITYTISTGAFTVSPNWETTPDATTTYDVLLPEGVTAGMIQGLVATVPGRTLDVATTGEAGVDFSNINGTLDAAEIGTGAITNAKFAAGAIDAAAIADGAIDAATFAAGAINAAAIATDAITNAKIAADAIGASEIADGAIDAATFAAGAINAAAIAADAIGASELAADAVAEIAAAILVTPSNLLATDSSGRVTVATNADKTGYALSSAGVDAILDDAITEPTTVFAWGGATLRNIIGWLGALSRNKITQSTTTQILFADDGSTPIAAASVSDSGTVATREEWT